MSRKYVDSWLSQCFVSSGSNIWHHIVSNGIFRRPFSSSCCRRVAATNRRHDLAVRGHRDWGTGVFAHTPPPLFSTASGRLIVHRSLSFCWPIERHFLLNMHLLHHDSSVIPELVQQRLCASFWRPSSVSHLSVYSIHSLQFPPCVV